MSYLEYFETKNLGQKIKEPRDPKPWDIYRLGRWELSEDEKEAPSAEDARKYFERELLRLLDASGEKKYPEKIGAYRAALACIYKQTPEKPEMKAMEGFAPEVASELCCPTCGGPVTNYWVRGAKPKHCQFCGQALDWKEGGAEV